MTALALSFCARSAASRFALSSSRAWRSASFFAFFGSSISVAIGMILASGWFPL
jgi:hypothetical protein